MKCAVAAALALLGIAICCFGQEASGGIDVRATVTAQAASSNDLSEAPRNGSGWAPGFRSIVYPTIKLDEHWSISGALEAISRPYDYEDFNSIGYGIRGRVLQANVAYSRTWKNGSVVIRAGQMLSTFGSFLLRYDDADNPLIGMPQAYGYYYAPVSTIGLAGAEADVTEGKWDGRVQFANSSPANPRSVFDKDQYANWAGGAGYTIRQGLRVGFSGYRGPWLDRQYPYFFPGEAAPRTLPASAIGIDGEWAAGHWNVRGEWQRFVLDYHVIPNFHKSDAYVEVKRVIHPRWFVAFRAGYLNASYASGAQSYETAVAYRPNSHQIVKAGYEVVRAQADGSIDKVFVMQVVTTLHPLSLAWR
jgi:hypothetical protein